MRIRASVVALTACLAAIPALPRGLAAQAVCSAPHSSPTLTTSGAIRALPSGSGWVQLSLYRRRSVEFFDPGGDSRRFLADSEFLTRSAFLTGAVGLVPGVELWAQVPVHSLSVAGIGGGSRSTGVGDIRLAFRLSATEALNIPVAVRIGGKIPGSNFPVDSNILPLTEGQRDWEIGVEAGGSLEGLPIYLVGWAGYRWREENREAARDPGDERFAHMAVGGSVGNLAWELAAEGLWGRVPHAQGFRLPADRRRLFQLLPTVGWSMGPGRLDVTSLIPVAGRNLPGGVGMSVGYRASWGSR